MNIKAIALTNAHLIVLSMLFLSAAQADEIAAPTVPATPASPPSATVQTVADADITPPSAPIPWYDRVFDQKLPLAFGMVAAEVSSDNIFYQPQKTADYITEISPFLNLTLGNEISLTPTLDQETIDIHSNSGNLNYLKVDYHPTITLYALNSKLNIVDEHADFLYSHQFAKLTLSVEQKYEKLSQPTLEENAVGTLVNRDVYTTTARASYIYSDKLSTYGNFNQIIQDYKTNLFTSSNEWIADGYFLYQLFPKLSVGLGPRIGFVDVDRAANQEYQSVLIHALYPATGKLSFVLAAGAELREFEHNESPEKVTPILEATATYKPFDSMTISLEADRHSIVSHSQIGENYTSSTVTLGLRQRFLQVVYLTVSGGFQDDAYSGAVTGSQTVRDDSFYFGGAGLEWASTNYLTLNGNYQYTRDASNIATLAWIENRFTLSATLKY